MLKRLAEACAALEDPSTGPFGEAQDRLRTGAEVEDESCGEAAVLQEALAARTDDRRIVAELLDVPVEHWWVSTLAGSYAGGTWG